MSRSLIAARGPEKFRGLRFPPLKASHTPLVAAACHASEKSIGVFGMPATWPNSASAMISTMQNAYGDERHCDWRTAPRSARRSGRIWVDRSLSWWKSHNAQCANPQGFGHTLAHRLRTMDKSGQQLQAMNQTISRPRATCPEWLATQATQRRVPRQIRSNRTGRPAASRTSRCSASAGASSARPGHGCASMYSPTLFQ